MRMTNTLSADIVADLPAPVIPDALKDIPGGAPNLIPIEALAGPVRVEFTLWTHSKPSPDWPEWVDIYCVDNDGEAVNVGHREWTQALPESERFVDIEPRYFAEGTLRFDYVGHVWNHAELSSGKLTVTVDKTKPELGDDDGRLQFPTLGGGQLTEDFLLRHDDQLLALIPDYAVAEVGDEITYYWDSAPYQNNEAGHWTLTEDDLGKPLQFVYEGGMIRDRLDGLRYAHYLIRDRAGNSSPYPVPASLDVAAQPLPRHTPALETPTLGDRTSVELALLDFSAPLDVIIPADAVIKAGEHVELLLGEEGSFGSWLEPWVEGQREYAVPMRNVVAMAGQVVKLRYRIVLPDDTLDSGEREVTVLPMPRNKLPAPQIPERTGDSLEVWKLTSNPRVTLAKWKHISTDQRITLEARGKTPSGWVTHPVLTRYKLIDLDVTGGIGSRDDVTIDLDFVKGLELGTQLIVSCTLSYDDGHTWPLVPSFEEMKLTLK
ncbi:hypothetical protein [Pseudomonas sp. TWI628]|uniref:hypothetical protein n=1 Tax=Pseudomonas sp. TWI628 TaxID=3136788 RepID=UPI003209D7FA